MLQANKPMGQTVLLPIQEPTSGITPSLAILDDAQALVRKEWRRGEPDKDMPRQYSTVSGNLTPTQPKCEDMKMDSTLNVTPEGCLNDLPVAVGGVEESRREPETQQDVCPSTNVVISAEETPNTFVKTVPGRDSGEQGLNQIEPPRRIHRTREASRDDVIALTRQFFATVNEQNQAAMSELPVEISAVTSEGNTLNLNISITSANPTVTEIKTRSPITFLSSGLPSRPTATATCRPLTWVQCVSEGKINEPS